jgi:hypothetical protein
VAALNWKQVIKNRASWAAPSGLKWTARRMLAAPSAHWRAVLHAFLWKLLNNIDLYLCIDKHTVYMPSSGLRGRERGQQVISVCLVRIYWRAAGAGRRL